MNENLRPSRLIGSVREKFKPFAHDGVFLDPGAICEMLRHFATIQSLANENEEELLIAERRLAALPQPEAKHAGNVVQIAEVRRAKRIHLVGPDGGDAA